MVMNELHGRHISNGTVRPLFIIFSAPGLNHDLRLLYGQKPVLVQALISKLAVEAFNKCVLDRLPRLDEVQPHPVLTGPRNPTRFLRILVRCPGSRSPATVDQ